MIPDLHSMAILGMLVLGGRPAQPAMVQKSVQQVLQVRSGDAVESYSWLTLQGMLVLEVTGPTNLGMRLRALGGPGEEPAPVDLTVVRDDQEQGTVRIQIPGVPEAGGVVEHPELGASEEVLVKVEVPAGRHIYRVVVSGPSRGAALAPFLGPDLGNAIVATPGQAAGRPDGTDAGKNPSPKPSLRPSAKIAALQAPPPEILAPV
jgi:hypothetical protein